MPTCSGSPSPSTSASAATPAPSRASSSTPSTGTPRATRRTRRKNEIATAKSAWLQKLAGWDHEEDDPGSTWNARAREADAPDRMAPRQVLRAIQDGLPPDAMVSTDIGNICAMANSYLPFERPRSFFAPGMFGNCGYAFPSIMGAKLAQPERAAVALVGDGAFGISLNELPTCDRMEIPVTIVVFRNEQWGAEKKNDILWFDERFVGTELGDPFSYADVSRGVRARGRAGRHHGGPDRRDARSLCAAQADGVTTTWSRWWSTRSSAPRSAATRCRTRRACCRATRTSPSRADRECRCILHDRVRRRTPALHSSSANQACAMHARIDIPTRKIAALCNRWQVVELALFGSVLRDDFGPDSDVDILVRFDQGARHTFLDIVRMQDELSETLGRNADLIERAAVEQSPNYIRRRAILESAETIYAA